MIGFLVKHPYLDHLHEVKFLAGGLLQTLPVWQSRAPTILASTRAHLGPCHLAPLTIYTPPAAGTSPAQQ